jgi:hypothetical protein
MHMNYYLVNDCWLMYLLSHNVMDHLINFMNNNRSSSLPLFHFPLITNPVISHIPFSLPVLRLIIVKRIFVLKWMKVAMSCVDCREVLLVCFTVDCCCNRVVTMLLPFHYIIFAQYKPLTYPRTLFHPPAR